MRKTPFGLKFFKKYEKHYQNQIRPDKRYSTSEDEFGEYGPYYPRPVMTINTFKSYFPAELIETVEFQEAYEEFQRTYKRFSVELTPEEVKRIELKILRKKEIAENQRSIYKLGLNKSYWNRPLEDDFKYLKLNK